MLDRSLPEWQLTLGDDFVLISHHEKHIAYNPRKIGFTISAGDHMGRIICHTCHQRIPFDVIDRYRKLVKLIDHGT